MNDCFEKVSDYSAILQFHWNVPNGLFNYIQAYIFCWLKLLFNFYAKRTVHRQGFGAKFNLSYPVMELLSRTSLNSTKSCLTASFPRGKEILK